MMRHAPLPAPGKGQKRRPRRRQLQIHRQRADRGHHAADPADLRTTADERPRHGHNNMPAISRPGTTEFKQ